LKFYVETVMGSPVIFLLLSIVAVAAALGMLLSRNAIHAALFLVLNFVTIAVFYLILEAPFIAMVQVTVYAGAIVVLFLFVIMLLGAERLQGMQGVARTDRWHSVLAIALALGLVAIVVLLLIQGPGASVETTAAADSSPVLLGLELFERYVFPFEVTGVLLLAAMIGVVVLGKSRRRGEDA
jgi:NADH-quinone oxidoreductase subunit J